MGRNYNIDCTVKSQPPAMRNFPSFTISGQVRDGLTEEVLVNWPAETPLIFPDCLLLLTPPRRRDFLRAMANSAIRYLAEDDVLNRYHLITKNPGMKEIVCNMGFGGIGDALQGLMAINALRRQCPDVDITYRVGRKAMPFVSLFTGYDHLSLHDSEDGEGKMVELYGPDLQMNSGYEEELQSRGVVPRWQRYAENIGASEVILPDLCEPQRIMELGKDCAGAIILCPFSDGPDREYSSENLQALENLLSAAGYRTIVLHNDAKRVRNLRMERLIGETPERVAGIIANSACVVGVDTGLSHLAGIMSKDVIVLTGQTTGPVVYGCYPKARWLEGPLACRGCFWRGPDYSPAKCLPMCPSLQGITPEQIFAEVDEVVFAKITAGRSLVGTDRLRVLRDMVVKTNGLAGDLAEAGSYRGGSAKLMAHFAAGKSLHVFDSLGVPDDDAASGGMHKRGDFACPQSELEQFLSGENIQLHLGEFPGTAQELSADTRFACVHLDMDTYQSTKAGLEYFWPRLLPGGACVLDDYGWKNCPGVRQAVEEVLPGVEVHQPARNQCVLIKPASSARRISLNLI